MSDRPGQLFQVNTFETGFVDGMPLNIPSTDSSGVAYYPPNRSLFIADSEIAELSIYPDVISENLFQVSLDGETLIQSYDLTDEATTGIVNDEPTGISYSTIDEHFYITNDNTFEVYRYDLQGEGEETAFVALDSISLEDLPPELPGITGDFEGVSVSPDSGLIYVVDGVGQGVVVLEYTDQFEYVNSFLLNSEEETIVSDPEGIAVNPETDNLFVISEVDSIVAEYTNEGEFIASYSLENLSPSQIATQGLTFAPASRDKLVIGKEDLSSLYIADGRVDNNDDPEERDGRIYETRPFIVKVDPQVVVDKPDLSPRKEDLRIGNSDIIDLTPSQGTISTTVSAVSNAGFTNIGGLYEAIDAQGTVIDPISGEEIAVGESGYADAALANSIVELGDGESSPIQLDGGSVYVPYLLANEVRFFSAYEEANADGLDHVQSGSENSFGFEDLLGGGDGDFNDFILSVEPVQNLVFVNLSKLFFILA